LLLVAAGTRDGRQAGGGGQPGRGRASAHAHHHQLLPLLRCPAGNGFHWQRHSSDGCWRRAGSGHNIMTTSATAAGRS
jgi:hypothetical protein